MYMDGHTAERHTLPEATSRQEEMIPQRCNLETVVSMHEPGFCHRIRIRLAPVFCEFYRLDQLLLQC
jgi:hypothetical protein